MNAYIAVTLLSVLSAIIFWQCAAYQANRAANLEVLLDDATREAERLRTSNGHLIAEAETLAIDLAHTEMQLVRVEAHAAYLRSCHHRANDVAAGTMLLGMAHNARQVAL